MENEVFLQLMSEIRQISIDQATMLGTLESVSSDVKKVKEAVYGNGAPGLKTELALLANKVSKLEALNEKMEKFEREDRNKGRDRTLTMIGMGLSFTMGLAGLIVGLLF